MLDAPDIAPGAASLFFSSTVPLDIQSVFTLLVFEVYDDNSSGAPNVTFTASAAASGLAGVPRAVTLTTRGLQPGNRYLGLVQHTIGRFTRTTLVQADLS